MAAPASDGRTAGKVADWASLTYVAVDVEGNGQQPPGLVELAAVPIMAGVAGEPASWLVKPATSITRFAARIHGLTDGDVADAPVFDAVRAQVLRALNAPAVVAHNAHVDVDVLRRELPGWETREVFDTLKLARRLIPGQRSCKLGALADALKLAGGLPEGLSAHRASYDALVAARLFVELARRTSGLEELRGASPGGEDEPAALF